MKYTASSAREITADPRLRKPWTATAWILARGKLTDTEMSQSLPSIAIAADSLACAHDPSLDFGGKQSKTR